MERGKSERAAWTELVAKQRERFGVQAPRSRGDKPIAVTTAVPDYPTLTDVVKPKRSKFGNEKVGRYDSKREAARAAQLRLLERAGEISDLRHHVKFLLVPSQYIDGVCVERKITYEADFVYKRAGKMVVEDVKGHANDRWALKRKLMLFAHNIRVQEV